MNNYLHSANTEKEPKSETKSAHKVFEERMGVLPDKETHWSKQRRVPKLINLTLLQERETAEQKLSILQHSVNREKFSAGIYHFLVVKYFPGGFYSPIGFGNQFRSKLEVFNFANAQKRSKVRIGKMVYDVAMELENETARLQKLQEIEQNKTEGKKIAIRLGYWKQGD